MNTDLTTISDLVTLKAMAYDEIALQEQSKGNLIAINNRISNIMQEKAKHSIGESSSDPDND